MFMTAFHQAYGGNDASLAVVEQIMGSVSTEPIRRDAGTRAERFYRADGWTETGKKTKCELIFEKRL
jgi:hypothetical protein